MKRMVHAVVAMMTKKPIDVFSFLVRKQMKNFTPFHCIELQNEPLLQCPMSGNVVLPYNTNNC